MAEQISRGVVHGRDISEWDRLAVEAERFLREQARLGRTTTYTELNAIVPARAGVRQFDFDRADERAGMGYLLGQVVERTYNEIGAMICSIVIYLNENDAGTGFYSLAQQMGIRRRVESSSGLTKSVAYMRTSSQDITDVSPPGRTRQSVADFSDPGRIGTIPT